jgi:hypothetical protein
VASAALDVTNCGKPRAFEILFMRALRWKSISGREFVLWVIRHVGAQPPRSPLRRVIKIVVVVVVVVAFFIDSNA